MQISMTKMTREIDLCCEGDLPHLLILLYCINYSDSREVVLHLVYTLPGEPGQFHLWPGIGQGS